MGKRKGPNYNKTRARLDPDRREAVVDHEDRMQLLYPEAWKACEDFREHISGDQGGFSIAQVVDDILQGRIPKRKINPIYKILGKDPSGKGMSLSPEIMEALSITIPKRYVL